LLSQSQSQSLLTTTTAAAAAAIIINKFEKNIITVEKKP
jgi:hypothetical protein